ncbi:hypothetical protein CaCOL14_005871 [Colletotrichum acutatum]
MATKYVRDFSSALELRYERGELFFQVIFELSKVLDKYEHHMMLWALSKEGEYDGVARNLVWHGIQPDQPLATSYSTTALHLAVRHLYTLQVFLLRGKVQPNLEVKNGAGQTPLCKAVCERRYESATLLLDRGASAEPIGRGKRPMDCAIHNKDEQMVKLLWYNGASIKSVGSKDQHGVVMDDKLGGGGKVVDFMKADRQPELSWEVRRI